MAKKPALTKSQLQTLRRKLEDERKRVVRVLEANTPGQEEADIEPEDNAQRATEDEHEIDVAERERGLLADIDRALAKMDAGTYGVSEKSGTPIPYARLRAVPWARSEADQ